MGLTFLKSQASRCFNLSTAALASGNFIAPFTQRGLVHHTVVAVGHPCLKMWSICVRSGWCHKDQSCVLDVRGGLSMSTSISASRNPVGTNHPSSAEEHNTQFTCFATLQTSLRGQARELMRRTTAPSSTKGANELLCVLCAGHDVRRGTSAKSDRYAGRSVLQCARTRSSRPFTRALARAFRKCTCSHQGNIRRWRWRRE